MSADTGMSKEEKEKLLSEKMERMRIKNEEMKKRHQEIESDRSNAIKISSSVKMSEVKPYVMKTPKPRPEKTDKSGGSVDPPPPRPSDVMPGRQRLSQSDGPPPDPSYRFLSDPDRDGLADNKKNKKEHGRGRGRGRGGNDRSFEGNEDENIHEGSQNIEDIEDNRNENTSRFGGAEERSSFRGRGGRGRGRGRGGNFDDKEGGGRGRGSGRRYEEDRLEGQEGQGFDRDGRGGRRGRGSFNSHDVRYSQEDNMYESNNERGGRKGSDRGGRGDFGNDRGDRDEFRNERGGRRGGRDDRWRDDRGGRGGRDDRGGRGGNDRGGRGRGNRGGFNNRQSANEYENGRDFRGRGSNERGGGRGRGKRGSDNAREYEAWKAEREAIDDERVKRAQSAGGAWRREWDNEKLDQGDNVEEGGSVYDPRFPKSKVDGLKLRDFMSHDIRVAEGSSPPQEGKQNHSDGPRGRGRGNRGRISHRGHGRNIDPELNAKRHEEEIMAELDAGAVFGDRKIEDCGNSFTISISNNCSNSSGGSSSSHYNGAPTRGQHSRGRMIQAPRPLRQTSSETDEGKCLEDNQSSSQPQRVGRGARTSSHMQGKEERDNKGSAHQHKTGKQVHTEPASQGKKKMDNTGKTEENTQNAQEGINNSAEPNKSDTVSLNPENVSDSSGIIITDGVTDDSWTDVSGSGNTSLEISGLSQEGMDHTNCEQKDTDDIKNTSTSNNDAELKDDTSQKSIEPKMDEQDKECDVEINIEAKGIGNKIEKEERKSDDKSEKDNEKSDLIENKEMVLQDLKDENSKEIHAENQKDNKIPSPTDTKVNTGVEKDKLSINDKEITIANELNIEKKLIDNKEITKVIESVIEKKDNSKIETEGEESNIENKENDNKETKCDESNIEKENTKGIENIQEDNEGNKTLDSNENKTIEKEDIKTSSKFKATEIVMKNGALSPTKIEELVPNLEWKQSQ